MPTLVDVTEMPNFDPSANTQSVKGSERSSGGKPVSVKKRSTPRGDHSVSEGKIYWDAKNKVCCKTHGAMLCVAPDRRLWRCIGCGAGAYVSEWDRPRWLLRILSATAARRLKFQAGSPINIAPHRRTKCRT